MLLNRMDAPPPCYRTHVPLKVADLYRVWCIYRVESCNYMVVHIDTSLRSRKGLDRVSGQQYFEMGQEILDHTPLESGCTAPDDSSVAGSKPASAKPGYCWPRADVVSESSAMGTKPV